MRRQSRAAIESDPGHRSATALRTGFARERTTQTLRGARWRSRRSNGTRGTGDESVPSGCWPRAWRQRSNSSTITTTSSSNSNRRPGNGQTTRTATAARTRSQPPLSGSDSPGPVIRVTAIRDRPGHRDPRGHARSLPSRPPTRRSLPSRRTLSTALPYSPSALTRSSR